MKMHTAQFVAAAVSACSMTAKTQSSEPSDSQSIVANIDAHVPLRQAPPGMVLDRLGRKNPERIRVLARGSVGGSDLEALWFPRPLQI
jgi:hypothetical protein